MLYRIYNKYNQGLYVGGCAVMSILTLGYLANDTHKIEKKQIINYYEKQINELKLKENIKENIKEIK
jgi:hypothetical protein